MIKYLDIQAITAQHAAEYQAAARRVIDSGWYLLGNETEAFEQQYAHYIGTKHCIGVANGLDALRLMLRAYKELGRMQEGDEVIVPANTYIATILAITDNQLVPVMVEPRFDTLELDTTRIEQVITNRTRAVLTVHLYGRLACNDQLVDVCHRHNLLLLEDNAQSHGCQWNHHRTGSLGDAAAHSFYPGKNLGAFGDAGAVTTNNAQLAATVRALGNYGSERKYVFRYAGLNSRMSEMDAALLSIKLRYLDADNQRRQELAAYYYAHIHNPLIKLPNRLPDTENVYHIFPVLCERRDELQAFLLEHGIQTMIHYPIPPHKQACYAAWNTCSYPITERIHATELSLPLHQALTNDEAAQIVRAVNAFK